jgi:hypothetical protein
MQASKPLLKGKTLCSQGDVTCIVGITGDIHGSLAVGFPNRTEHHLQDAMPTVSDAKGQKICYAFPGPIPVIPYVIGEDGVCVLKVVLPDALRGKSDPPDHQMASGSTRPSA